MIRWLPVLLLALTAAFWLPQAAFAYDFTQQTPAIGANGQVCPGYGLTRRLIPCLKETIIDATYWFLMPFSRYMSNITAAMCTLAVMFWGVQMAGARTSAPIKDLAMTLLKVAAVGMLSLGFGANWLPNGGMFPIILDALEDFLAIVSQYAMYSNVWACPNFNEPTQALQMWNTVDCALETLIGGIYSPFTMSLGLVGFLTACIFSEALGFFIAVIGFYLILQLLFAIARALYMFVSSYIGICIMVIMSPIFVPMLLTRGTKPYFDKWLRLIFSFALQPVFVFVYLAMLTAAYNSIVYTAPFSIAHALAGPDADLPNFNLGGWLSGSGAFGDSRYGQQAVTVDPKQAVKHLGLTDTDTGMASVVGKYIGQGAQGWQGDVYEMLGVGNQLDPVTGQRDLRFFETFWDITAIDWVPLAYNQGKAVWDGLNNTWDVTQYVVPLFISFLMAAVTAFIFMTMLDYLPYLSSGLAAKPIGLPTLGKGSMAPPGSNAMESLNAGMRDRFSIKPPSNSWI